MATSQLKAAILIAAAKNKLTRDQLRILLISLVPELTGFIPVPQRRSLDTLHSKFFSDLHTTYNQHIRAWDCWRGLMEFTSPEDHQLITALLE